MDAINIQICLTHTLILKQIVHTSSSAVGFCASGCAPVLLLKQEILSVTSRNEFLMLKKKKKKKCLFRLW